MWTLATVTLPTCHYERASYNSDSHAWTCARYNSYQQATFMRIFTYKLATYLSTGDVAGLRNALFCNSCRVSRMCSGIPGSYRVLGLRLGFRCMSLIDMPTFRRHLKRYLFCRCYSTIWSCLFATDSVVVLAVAFAA